MSERTVDIASGINGGAVKLLDDPKRARNIHVVVVNPTAATHGVFFGRSRRELASPPVVGIKGYPVIAVPNTVANQTIGTVAYTTAILQGWTGELWVAADASGTGMIVDVMEGAAPEK